MTRMMPVYEDRWKPCVILQSRLNNHSRFKWEVRCYLLFVFFSLLSEVDSAAPLSKPVPKPRSNAPDKQAQLAKTHKDTVLDVSQTVERHRTPSDVSRSNSLSSPTHENLQCTSGDGSPDATHSNDPPAVSTDSHSQGDSEDGNFFSNSLIVSHQSLVVIQPQYSLVLWSFGQCLFLVFSLVHFAC